MPAPPLRRALLLLALSACDAPPPDPVSGLVLITVDTLRADHVGGEGSLTPALDRLAAEGLVVTDAFTPTPTTGPAHASLFLGQHPWRHRVVNNAEPLPEGLTLAELAQQRGYRTAAVVSSFVLDARFGFDRGFEDYRFEPTEKMHSLARPFYSRGVATTDHALEQLDEVSADGAPFFLWVHYFDPHFPYHPPEDFQVTSEPVAMQGKSLPADNEDVADMEQLGEQIRLYRGEVRYVDAAIGRLLERLDERGLAESTAVVVTSDHGEGLGDHGWLGHGENLYNELVRVPLVIRSPGLPRGVVREGPAQLEDLFPTLASLLGAHDVEGTPDGFDLLPWLRGDEPESPRPAVVGRRKRLEDRPTLYFEWRRGEKWIGEIDASGLVFDSDWNAGELDGAPADGAPAWLRFKTEGGSLADGARGELDPKVEEGLRALGYVK